MQTSKRIPAFALCLCMMLSMLVFTGTAQEKAVSAQDDVRFEYAHLYDNNVTITAVHNCPKTLRIPGNLDGYTVTKIDAVLGGEAIEEVICPTSLYTIGKEVFRDCKTLRRVILSPKTERVCEDAFADCTSLSYVGTGETVWDCCVFPSEASNIIVIEKGAFRGCTSLTGIILPELYTFGTEAFAGCTGLKRVVYYGSKIGSRAFADCGTIDGFVLLNLAKKISRNAFDNTEIGTFVYSGSADHFRKNIRVTFQEGYPGGGLFALGADIRYKSSGRLSELVDPRVTEYGGQFSTTRPYLLIAADGDTYSTNVSFSDLFFLEQDPIELCHPMYDQAAQDYGFKVPAYASIYCTWWQQLIRIFMLGFIWY